MQHTPYVYLIWFARLKKWYCGSETSAHRYKVANPANLLRGKYKTGSKICRRLLRDGFEEGDKVICFAYPTPEAARQAEIDFHAKHNVAKSRKYLNLRNAGQETAAQKHHTQEFKDKVSKRFQGNTFRRKTETLRLQHKDGRCAEGMRIELVSSGILTGPEISNLVMGWQKTAKGWSLAA